MRKNIIITGASSGLGAGMAREFAQRGCNVALCARRVDRLEALGKELLKSAPFIKLWIRELDVTNDEQVFQVFKGFREDMGTVDRVIVNAGIGGGAPIGRGQFAVNRRTVETNFLAAMAQSEAAMEIFRAQEYGHLVIMSSVTAARGLRGSMTAYSSSKAAVAAMAEGIRGDVLNKPRIRVTTLFPGYIRTEMNEKVDPKKTPYIVDAQDGCRLLAAAIEREPDTAYVPWWPWAPFAWFMRRAPLSWVKKAL